MLDRRYVGLSVQEYTLDGERMMVIIVYFNDTAATWFYAILFVVGFRCV